MISAHERANKRGRFHWRSARRVIRDTAASSRQNSVSTLRQSIVDRSKGFGCIGIGGRLAFAPPGRDWGRRSQRQIDSDPGFNRTGFAVRNNGLYGLCEYGPSKFSDADHRLRQAASARPTQEIERWQNQDRQSRGLRRQIRSRSYCIPEKCICIQ